MKEQKKVDEVKEEQKDTVITITMNQDELKEFILDIVKKSRPKRINTEKEDPLLNKEKHKNKRILAYLSFFFMIGFLLFLFLRVEPSDMDHYDTIIVWTMSTFSFIILGYMGVSGWTANMYEKRRGMVHKNYDNYYYDDSYDNSYEYEGNGVGDARGNPYG